MNKERCFPLFCPHLAHLNQNVCHIPIPYFINRHSTTDVNTKIMFKIICVQVHNDPDI